MIRLILLRRLLLLLSVVFCFAAFAACSDKTAAQPRLDVLDIYAADVSVQYDGRPHSITVKNTLPTDTVLYSTDGKMFSASLPVFVLPNDYTVYFKVIRSGYAEFSSSAVVTIAPIILDGIRAENENIIYDGLPHSINIDGTLPTDKITYSTDGITFSTDVPSFTEIGVYTVYFRVERLYGDYKSSCTLTIVPDIFGRYFNSSFGLIVLTTDCAYVNSIKQSITIGLDGSGYIDNTPFAFSDDSILYDSLIFTALSDEQCVYKLLSSDLSCYFCCADKGALTITIEDNIGNIMLDEQTLMSVNNVNYCESADITDYAKLTFKQAFSKTAEITEINVAFSLREVNPVTVPDLYFTYDGSPHSFDFSTPAIFPNGNEPTYTEIGKYTVTVLFVSEEYLPLFLDCTLVILPNIDGVYFSPQCVLKFNGTGVYKDGEYSGELNVLEDHWAFDNIPITVTGDGLQYDGIEYTAAQNVMIVKINGNITARMVIPADTKQLIIEFDGTELTFTCHNTLLLTVSLNGETVSVNYNEDPVTPNYNESSVKFILGTAELSTDILLISVLSE